MKNTILYVLEGYTQMSSASFRIVLDHAEDILRLESTILWPEKAAFFLLDLRLHRLFSAEAGISIAEVVSMLHNSDSSCSTSSNVCLAEYEK